MELYPYQNEGVDFLAARNRAILADTMGLGKTAQAIVACNRLHAGCIVVICPASVRINWHREFKRFSNIERNYSVILSNKDRLTLRGVNIMSYEAATTPAMKKKLAAMEIDVLILDEAHFLKTRTAKRTEAIYGVHCKGDTGIISRAKFVWALTGTPTPNHPGEIYSLLRAFGAWKASYYAFEDKFCQVRQGDWGPVITGMKNVEELKALVKPIMLRRKVEEVMTDLPKVTINTIALSAFGIAHEEDIAEWQKAEQSKDGRMLKTRVEQAAEDQNIDLHGIHIATLQRVTGMAKIRPVCEMVMRELDSGLNKIVIFGQHRDVIEGCRQVLQKYGAQVIYGGNTPEVKQQRIDKFMNVWKYRVLIGHIKTLGTGVDGLQKVCNNGLFIESSWSPAENIQAIGRLRRTGQSKPVNIRFASLAGSLDETVQEANARKTRLVSQLLD